MLLVGFTHSDTIENVNKMAKKIVGLRIFEDECGKLNKGIKDIGGSILAISQFTLYADCRKGNRPSFINAGNPELANELYRYIIEKCKDAFKDKKTFYKQSFINYRGKTEDTDEYFTEVIAEFLCNHITEFMGGIEITALQLQSAREMLEKAGNL